MKICNNINIIVSLIEKALSTDLARRTGSNLFPSTLQSSLASSTMILGRQLINAIFVLLPGRRMAECRGPGARALRSTLTIRRQTLATYWSLYLPVLVKRLRWSSCCRYRHCGYLCCCKRRMMASIRQRQKSAKCHFLSPLSPSPLFSDERWYVFYICVAINSINHLSTYVYEHVHT